MATPVILIAGRDPEEEIGGGHSSYVRAHARAAIRAGFEPHLFCVSDRRGDDEADYGFVHRSPRNGRPPARQSTIRHHAEPLRDAMVRRSDLLASAAAIHGFGVWTYAAALPGRHVPEAAGPRRIMSMYTVYEEEHRAQYDALGFRKWSPAGVRRWREWAHVRRRVTPCERLAIEWSDAVAVNYASVRSLVLAHHPQAANKLVTAPYGPGSAFLDDAPPRTRAIEGHRDTEPTIVSVALQHPKKGGAVLVEALRILRDQGHGFHARLVGGGSQVSFLRSQIRRAGLADRVEMPGIVPDVRPWVADCDIYVQPSIREESGSLALLEAMQLGRPVICSDVDGLREDVRDGADGVLVPPSDPVALARAILRLLADPGLRHRLGAAARRRFTEDHGPELFAAGLATLYAPAEGTPGAADRAGQAPERRRRGA